VVGVQKMSRHSASRTHFDTTSTTGRQIKTSLG